MGGELELAVVVPTFNECGNVEALVSKLDQALAGLTWEAIFVDDDSPDGTADLVRALAAKDRRVRIIQRIGRRGLATACVEGMCATAAPVAAVIDGDLQHDEALLPRMAAMLRDDPGLDLVVGSRFAPGGGTGDWARGRAKKSAVAARLSRRLLRAELSDPMSGFFAIRTAVVRRLAPDLSGIGFKILLDILTASPGPLRVAELPYVFRTRAAGESKLDRVVAMEYLVALWDRAVGQVVPARFALFCAIGLIGVLPHMAVLALLYAGLGVSFVAAEVGATGAAMTGNFLLNNALTYRDRRLRGGRALLLGWAKFCAVCAVGAAANVGVAALLHGTPDGPWISPALAGIAASAVWNYALSRHFVWGRY